jgi:hypothetical protein
MTTNHPILNHTRVVTLGNTKSILGTNNKILPDSTTLNNSGIQIHGGLVSHFFTMISNGMQGVPTMATHSTKYVLITSIRYPIYVRNKGILA